MKKIYFSLIILFFGLRILGNPIALPTIEISEVYFDEIDNWKLELGYFEINQEGFVVDSIFISSSYGNLKLPSYVFAENTGVLVITKDSLDSNFAIKRFADTLKVVYYIQESPFEDSLIFGSHTGAFIDYPKEGQSISRYGRYFVKDKSPTIGTFNDTIGMCGALTGIILNRNSEPVQDCSFQLDFDFNTSIDGKYQARVLAKPSTFNMIFYRSGYALKSASISEISYAIEPDSVIELDIYLLDSLETGIAKMAFDYNPVIIYPNPVSTNEWIHISTDLPFNASEIWLEVIDISGRLVRKEKIIQQENSIEAPTISGIYIVSIWNKSQRISSNRILVR
jgi:hypothetical protein